jgi:hypothetical protein
MYCVVDLSLMYWLKPVRLSLTIQQPSTRFRRRKNQISYLSFLKRYGVMIWLQWKLECEMKEVVYIEKEKKNCVPLRQPFFSATNDHDLIIWLLEHCGGHKTTTNAILSVTKLTLLDGFYGLKTPTNAPRKKKNVAKDKTSL